MAAPSGARFLITAMFAMTSVCSIAVAGIHERFAGPVHSFFAGRSPAALCVADFTGDGIADVAVANAFSGSAPCSVTVLAGNGRGDFGRVHAAQVGIVPTGLAAGDVNGDLVTDLVVCHYNSHDVAVLLGAGNGTFAAPHFVPCGVRPTAVALADFDLDGSLDLAVANDVEAAAGTVSILLNGGDGQFGAPQPFAVPGRAVGFDVADLNGDLKPDVVVATGGALAQLLGNGNGTLADGMLISPVLGSRSVVVGDLNGDSWPDLVACNGNHTVSTLIGSSSGYFQVRSTVASATDPREAEVAELDGDGVPDVVLVGHLDECVQWFAGQGDGRIAVRGSIGVPHGPIAIEAADLTQDGRPDVMVNSLFSNTISSLAGDGAGGWGHRLEFPTHTDPRVIVAGDWNADGRLDVATGNYAQGSVSVLHGTGEGAFASRTDHPTFPGTIDLASTDLNGDGLADFVSVDHPYGSSGDQGAAVSVLLGRSDGGYTTLPPIPVSTCALKVQPARFDDDPYPDLLLSGWCVYTMRGRGDGTFDPPVAREPRSSNAVAGDLDADGRDDLVVTVWPYCSWVDDHTGECHWWESGEFYVQQTAPDGAFGARAHTPPSETYSELRLLDLTGDGRLDLVGAAGGGIAVLPGIGGIGFGPRVLSPLPARYDRITFGDLDRDGFLDAVITYPVDGHSHHAARFMSMLRGDGSGGFDPPARLFAFGAAVTGAVVGDFDEDAWPDIAVSTGLSSVFLLRNAGDTPTSTLVSLAEAVTTGGTVRLAWSIADGVVVREVQRRMEGSWRGVGAVNAQGNGRHVFEERGLEPGTHLYRLAYVAAGTPAYSEAVSVDVIAAELAVQAISPNPMSPSGGVVRLSLAHAAPALLEVFDIQGRRRSHRILEAVAGPASVSLATSRWPAGVYVLRLSQAGRAITRNFAVVR